MTLVKTSILNGIAVLVRTLALLGLNKVLAVYVGPAGYATIGQFQNAVQMVTTLATGAVNTGVTKYTAEYYDDEELQRRVWRTAGSITLIASVIASVLIAAFSTQLASWLLKDAQYSGILIWLGTTIFLSAFNALLLAIINGKKEIRSYVVANIAGSIFSFCVTAVMASRFGLYGALLALATFQSLSFIVTLFICRKSTWFKVRHVIGKIDVSIAQNLGKFTLMALTSAIVVPLSQILVRNYLGDTFGWSSAGQWEAVWRLSSAYLLLVTTTLSIYYLPRLSELKSNDEISREIAQGYKLILPAAIFSAAVIYIFRDFIISTLFSKDFWSTRNLVAWQLVGDVLKIGSWILSYLMLSKALLKAYVVTEIIFSFGFVLLTLGFTKVFGLKGVTIAYATTYGLYWLTMLYLMREQFTVNLLTFWQTTKE